MKKDFTESVHSISSFRNASVIFENKMKENEKVASGLADSLSDHGIIRSIRENEFERTSRSQFHQHFIRSFCVENFRGFSGTKFLAQTGATGAIAQ